MLRTYMADFTAKLTAQPRFVVHRYGPERPASPGGFPCPPGKTKLCERTKDTLPVPYQYLGDEVTGGYNEAMDYAPVCVTEFDCMHNVT